MITLKEYSDMREDHWDNTIRKAIREGRRKPTYGTCSADAIIRRFRKYEKEYYQLYPQGKGV